MSAAVTERTPSDAVRRRGPYAMAGAIAVASLGLRLRDPHVQGSWGFCPLRALTGLDCPFCGGLRAVNDLTHGHLGAAATSNLYFVASLPLLVVLWLWWLRSERPTPVLRAVLGVWVVLGVVFTVFRNTPWGADLWA
ncbi:DUF2752 domain-containing protein [Nocardioides mangrovicus]|uniref:DUF2752 domain-containing protein n=1 Tax=Nocardioides mangrovicus TaxID=2478913 RepID=A0A3L8P309_9ACTN|nr:DUF2752 domain-containing protein [Nocardioides mangrovicus]RLV49534.1 DUF2752 domain-containing protein [Nocardioides mangrovicus]